MVFCVVPPRLVQTCPGGLLIYLLLLLLLSRFSCVRFCATPWTAAYKAPPSMGFSRQEYGGGLPLPSPFEAEGPTLNVVSTIYTILI